MLQNAEVTSGLSATRFNGRRRDRVGFYRVFQAMRKVGCVTAVLQRGQTGRAAPSSDREILPSGLFAELGVTTPAAAPPLIVGRAVRPILSAPLTRFRVARS